MLGIVANINNEKRFYFSETNLGIGITSSNKDYVEHAREAAIKYHTNIISLKDVLKEAGTELVDNPEKADIDLSPNKIERGKILSYIT